VFLASGSGGYTFQVGVLAILVEASGKEHSRVSSPEAFEVSSHRLVIPPWASGCGGEAVGQSQGRVPVGALSYWNGRGPARGLPGPAQLERRGLRAE
jgi:hypothetical protein